MEYTLKKRCRFAAMLSLLLLCSCRGTGSVGGTATGSASATAEKNAEPVQYTYVVKNTYPHSTESYTQGLYWHDGYLWESRGQRGHSALMQVELETGRIIKSIPLPDRDFGEGMALLNGKIYQLTWDSETAYVYDAATLEKIGQFTYKGEGWGLTTDGKVLYMSDGTDRIYAIDPSSDFSRKAVINVKMGKKRVFYLNELEWIDGKIWANVYMTDAIVIIDPVTGQVEGVADLTGILPESDRKPYTDVLNGIAFDPETGRIFVTGKYWGKLFEIELKRK